MAKTFAGVVTPVLEPRLEPGESRRGVIAASYVKTFSGEERRDGVVAMAELLAAARRDGTQA